MRNSTIATDVNNIKDTDDAEVLLTNKNNELQFNDGWFRRYWSNGNLRYEWEYKDGKRVDGLSYGYYEDGKIKTSIEWKDGKVDGYRTEYWESGNKLQKIHQKQYNNKGIGAMDGVFHHGPYTCWHETGEIEQRGIRVNGKEEGLKIWYNRDGTIQSEEIWEDNKLVSKTLCS
tara:strand:- start:1117 stop:1635 length:519 start_codon:yes stop_codon:yes gene_type:complete